MESPKPKYFFVWQFVTWLVFFVVSVGAAFHYAKEVADLVDNRNFIRAYRGTLRVGVYNWPGYYPLVVAAKSGLFKKYGIDVELAKAKTIGQMNDWLCTGATQVSAGLLTDFIVLQNIGAPIQMPIATDYSMSDVILSHSRFKKPKDLEGQRIGISELNSFAEYFIVRSLELAGVNVRKVRFYSVPFDQVPAAIENGTVEAGHTWDPALAEGLRLGLKPLVSSAENPSFVTSGVAFRQELLTDDRIPKAVTQAYFEALKLQSTDPQKYLQIVAETFEISTDEAARYIRENIKPISFQENLKIFAKDGLIRKEAKSIADFFVQRGLEISSEDLEILLDNSVLKKIDNARIL